MYMLYIWYVLYIYILWTFFFQIESDDFYQRLKKLEHCAKCNMYYQDCDKFILLDFIHYMQSIKIQTHNPLES